MFYPDGLPPRQAMHYKQFNAEAQSIWAEFYATVAEGLKEKLGPGLFQLPPKAAYTEELLAHLLDSLDPAFQNRVEFRHSSW